MNVVANDFAPDSHPVSDPERRKRKFVSTLVDSGCDRHEHCPVKIRTRRFTSTGGPAIRKGLGIVDRVARAWASADTSTRESTTPSKNDRSGLDATSRDTGGLLSAWQRTPQFERSVRRIDPGDLARSQDFGFRNWHADLTACRAGNQEHRCDEKQSIQWRTL